MRYEACRYNPTLYIEEINYFNDHADLASVSKLGRLTTDKSLKEQCIIRRFMGPFVSILLLEVIIFKQGEPL